MAEKILVPDVGEAEDVEVIEILVAVGDEVEVDDSLVVLESDKASMEIPSPKAGKILEIHVKEGDNVEEGKLIVELEVAGEGDASGDEDSAESKNADADNDDEKSNADEGKGEQASEDEASEHKDSEKPASKDKASKDKASKQDDEAGSDESSESKGERTEQVIAVPDLGEASDITVTEILVKVGDDILIDDSLVVLESDKASMEIPATSGGEVLEILVKEGDEVNEGDALVKIASNAAGEAPSSESQESSRAAKSSGVDAREPKDEDEPKPQEKTAASDSSKKVHAGPAVRKQAREYGVDLGEVKGSGRQGRVLKEDIQTYVKKRLSEPAAASGGAGIPAVPEVDFSKFGETELVPMSRIKQASAKNLHRSWLNVPHVTQFDEADITELEAFRKQQNTELQKDGTKLTPLAFLVKACVNALQTYPQFNSSLQADYKNLIHKHYYNIGVAVETPDGLVVPVIKDADKKGIVELATETSELAAKARDKKLPMDAMQGATFTISSLGGIGGTKFTPIVNAPEVAILGVSRSKVEPVWNGNEFVPRTILPLSLSYDHRAIDGAEAARFTNYLGKVLTDVRRLLL
jgi:pyruvate dehydrogenase E2 component (dihydrolipoamide acetyltransferase)